ncbi:MAG TPA: RluA family pseudouridine synthase [Fimbriimonadaceae bacterium]|nr:RluA family pseudouridine synthase [Fimbriimonadaceae bacterium]HRJ95153.1 RluA family pseudouridine synthase [Fimbriimonadaceae bacterium]
MLLTADREERLDRFLARMMPEHSRSRLVKVIESGGVQVEGLARKASFRVEPGQLVQVGEVLPEAAHDLAPADIPLKVVYEDDVLLVVDKPRGIAVHPAIGHRQATLVNALLARSHALSEMGGSFRPGIVHRLDKDTTGLIMIAKNDGAHRSLQNQIQLRLASRRYLAVAWGDVAPDIFTIQSGIGRDPADRRRMKVIQSGKTATTHVHVISHHGDRSLLALALDTGRTHQIRVHLAWMGHPVKGDPIYANGEWSKGPLQLHAGHLSFLHPDSKERLTFFADPPPDFEFREPGAEALDRW